VAKPWQRILIFGLAFLIAVTGTFVFAYRAGKQVRHIHSANEPVRPWMSIPFIAHTRHVPAPVLFQAIGVQPEPRDRRSVRRLAHDLHRSVPDLMAQLQQALNTAAQPSAKQPQ
jgi:hypothetical protein